eukprot:9722693-Heterocapsa_arctica.AAC.1
MRVRVRIPTEDGSRLKYVDTLARTVEELLQEVAEMAGTTSRDCYLSLRGQRLSAQTYASLKEDDDLTLEMTIRGG